MTSSRDRPFASRRRRTERQEQMNEISEKFVIQANEGQKFYES